MAKTFCPLLMYLNHAKVVNFLLGNMSFHAIRVILRMILVTTQ